MEPSPPLAGLKSISEAVLELAFLGGVGEAGGEETAGTRDLHDAWDSSGEIELPVPYCGEADCSLFNRASLRAFSFNARWTSSSIRGSVMGGG